MDAFLTDKTLDRVGVLDGGLTRPHFMGGSGDSRTVRQMAFIIDEARRIRAGGPSRRAADWPSTQTAKLVEQPWPSRARSSPREPVSRCCSCSPSCSPACCCRN